MCEFSRGLRSVLQKPRERPLAKVQNRGLEHENTGRDLRKADPMEAPIPILHTSEVEEAMEIDKSYRERRVQLNKPGQYGGNSNITEKTVILRPCRCCSG